MSKAAETEEAIEIPSEALAAETLRRLVEEFVTRDGTDYGRREKDLEQKVADVMRQLRQGEAKIVFDPHTATANIVATRRRG